MADATATFLLTARDATAAAFSSANKNLQQIQRSVAGVRRIMSAFGVGLGVNVFASWIRGAMDVNKLSDEQKTHLEGSLKAMNDLRTASNGLARDVAESLTPAMVGLSNALTGVRAGFFGASPFPFEKEINDLEPKVRTLKNTLDLLREGAIEPNMFLDETKLSADLERLTAQLEEYRQKQRQAFGISLPGDVKRDLGDLSEITVRSLEEIRRARNELGLLGMTADTVSAKFEQVLNPDVAARPLDDVLKWRETLGLMQLPPESPIQAQFRKQLETMGDDAELFAKSVGGTLHDTMVDSLMGVETSFKDTLKRMAYDLAISSLFKGLASIAGGPTTLLGKMFGGFRAQGGPVSAGKGYVVGENGPEWFTPRSSGAIVPAMAGAGGVTIVQHNDFRGVDPSAELRIGAALQRNKRETIAEVKNLRDRGRL